MRLSKFLRTVLKLDAASCLGMAALVLPAAAALEGPLGVSGSFLIAAAVPLVPLGLFILWLGMRNEAAAGFVWLVIIGNVAWTAASLAAAGGLPDITPLGKTVVAGQGLGVLALAIAELAGLRVSQKASLKSA